ncbi:MAG: DUF1543 domain-containing protein [Bacteroidetes bacterium]|nr:DUF1543 domain-containing protein [Bacteroidota bacterium]
MNKLFLIHLGYYDEAVCKGLYECHTNVFIVAADFEDAKSKAKQLDIYQAKKMHIDGMQLIEAVNGFLVDLKLNKYLNGEDRVTIQHAF